MKPRNIVAAFVVVVTTMHEFCFFLIAAVFLSIRLNIQSGPSRDRSKNPRYRLDYCIDSANRAEFKSEWKSAAAAIELKYEVVRVNDDDERRGERIKSAE